MKNMLGRENVNDFCYEKEIIGYLIKYYRKQSNLKLNDFLNKDKKYYNEYCSSCTKCRNKNIICTTATLYKIEKGFSSINECFYHQLSNKINKQILFDNKLNSRLLKYRKKVKACLISNSKNEISKLLATITKDKIKYENTLYVNEILSLYYDALSNRYYHYIPSKSNIELYAYLKSLNNFNIEDKKIILLLLYKTYTYFCNDIKSLHDLIEESKMFFEDKLLFEIQLFSNQDEELNSFLAMNTTNEDDLEPYQQFLLNDCKAYMCLNMRNPKNALTFLLKNEKLCKSANFCDSDILNLYRRLGIVSFSLEKYNDAVNYLKKVFQYSTNDLQANYLIFFCALEKTNQINELNNIILSINLKDISNDTIKYIIKYYSKKHKKTLLNKLEYSELEDYICEDLNVNSLKSGIYTQILHEELKFLVSKTQNYKKLLLYEKGSS